MAPNRPSTSDPSSPEGASRSPKPGMSMLDTVCASSATLPTDQLGPLTGVSFVVQLAPVTVWVGPLDGRWSDLTSCEPNADEPAPLSTTKAYGPCPAMHTGARAIAAAPCLTTLIGTRLTAALPLPAGWLTAGQPPGEMGGAALGPGPP